MDDDSFPQETLLDAAAMFRFLTSSTELNPTEMELEWVFATSAAFELADDAVTALLEAFTQVIEPAEEMLRAEVHEEESDDAPTAAQFLLIYTGKLSQDQLQAIHRVLNDAARQFGGEYLGVECGQPGAMDEMKVGSFIEWTEELLDETAHWKIEDLDQIAADMRSRHVESAQERGLDVADWMPTAAERGYTQLRPQSEIVRRLMAAHATLAWVCAPDEIVPPPVIKSYVKDNALKRQSFSKREAHWIGTARREVRQEMSIAGWITENIWSLAWILGHAPTVCPCEQQMPQSIMVDIRDNFLRQFDRSFDDLMEASSLQPLELIVTLEDFLYCIHNGFRNMQDVERAGLIQERRQSLTWALSPGVNWDDTDVST